MRFHRELSYAAPREDVFAMLADPAFREKVAHAQHVESVEVSISPSDSGFRMVSDQQQRTGGLPAIAKKFVGETTQAIITEDWGDPSGATMTISAPGKPTTVAGTVALEPTSDCTTQVVDLDIKVKVPLISGKLEKLLADAIGAGYDIEHAVAQAWLTGDR